MPFPAPAQVVSGYECRPLMPARAQFVGRAPLSAQIWGSRGTSFAARSHDLRTHCTKRRPSNPFQLRRLCSHPQTVQAKRLPANSVRRKRAESTRRRNARLSAHLRHSRSRSANLLYVDTGPSTRTKFVPTFISLWANAPVEQAALPPPPWSTRERRAVERRSLPGRSAVPSSGPRRCCRYLSRSTR